MKFLCWIFSLKEDMGSLRGDHFSSVIDTADIISVGSMTPQEFPCFLLNSGFRGVIDTADSLLIGYVGEYETICETALTR
jgi:hypothetical protein